MADLAHGYRACSVFALVTILTGCVGAGSTPLTPSPAEFAATYGATQEGARYHLLFSFENNGKSGKYPSNGLAYVGGKFYGTTNSGNTCIQTCQPGDAGTEFSITASGHEKVLYDGFQGLPNAILPNGPLTYLKGELFGTSPEGGSYLTGYFCGGGCGTVFELSTTGSEKVLYDFKGGSDGMQPSASLLQYNGLLYGVTLLGGLSSRHCEYGGGCGTIFDITPSGKKRILHMFKGYPSDGSSPGGALIDVAGSLYSTSGSGGDGTKCGANSNIYGGCGTIFSVSSSGRERVLYSFKGPPDGAFPTGGLVYVNGLLYGTTGNGGKSKACQGGCGTFFSVTTSGTEHVIYSFKGGQDVSQPQSLLPYKGLFYGIGAGTAFSISPSGHEVILHRFSGGTEGGGPTPALTVEDGILYGTTDFGGKGKFGTVFTLTP